ncbi:hypothetical protein MKEN_01020800 [Mycena kentingensis (nom. inval.)]|nr:hypothetical protein MKEN_01020800 [Mycena kentingensis (nom. inval.)]
MPSAATTALERLPDASRKAVELMLIDLGFKKAKKSAVQAPVPPPANAQDDDEDDDNDDDDDEPPRKRRKGPSKYSKGPKHPLEHCDSSGRWYKRAGHAYHSFDDAAMHGAMQKWAPDEVDNMLMTGADEDVEIHQRRVTAFERWYTQIGRLDKNLPAALEYLYAYKSKAWQALVTRISARATNQQTNDTRESKDFTDAWLPDPHKDQLFPPVSTVSQAKPGRDKHHPATLRLLLSPVDRKLLPDLTFTAADLNPELDLVSSDDATAFLEKVANNTFTFNLNTFASFLYFNWKEFNPADILDGFLRGSIVVRTLRLEWIGLARAVNGIKAGKSLPPKCKARTHRMYKVTAEMVAYAVCQARTAMQEGQWSNVIGDFDYEALYNGILDLFSSQTTRGKAWAEETLAYLTQQVFGGHELPEDGDDMPAPKKTNAFALAMQQLADVQE